MEVKQIATLVNNITKEIDSAISILEEDLSNVVAVGESLQNAQGLDNFVKALPDQVGRMVFVNRKYPGGAPSILMDGWEYGSICEKIRSKMPEAEENEAWQLEDNTTYEMQVFHKPYASAKFFNKALTFEVPLSITEKQVKEAFLSAGQLNAFVEMLYNEVEKSMTIKLDGLVMRTINNFAAETIYNGLYSSTTSTVVYGNTSARAINLLKLYNDAHAGATITAAQSQTHAEFNRFATATIAKVRDYMKFMSTHFNMGGTEKFTPAEYQKLIVLSDFAKNIGVYLYDAQNQYRTDNLSIGEFETVPYWQAADDYSFNKLSEIKVKTVDGHSVDCTGILAVLFDKDACAVCNQDRYVTTAPYNAKGEFWNQWHKWKCSYLNDYDENFVVFFVHDAA